MSAPDPPEGNLPHGAGPGSGPHHAAAVTALQAAFTRLRPQGSDAWNFLAAFTHLGDRYGPYHPGASDLSRQMEADNAPVTGRNATLTRRVLQRAGLGGSAASGGTVEGRSGDPAGSAAQSEFEQAMAQVVEAFRFLSARVRTLEERLANEDHPVDGAAWFLPAAELGAWVEPVAAGLVEATPGGEILHGDCGEGALLGVLAKVGLTARGVEPRGSVALKALEDGHAVAMAEMADELASCAPASLGGVVLSGVVDRLPLHALVLLLHRSRQALALGAPIIVVASDPEHSAGSGGAVARDLVHPNPLHAETWTVLLQRAGFVSIAPLAGSERRSGDQSGGGDDTRFALSATAPA